MVVARREVWSEKGDETVSRTVEEWGSGGGHRFISGQGEKVEAGADGWRTC